MRKTKAQAAETRQRIIDVAAQEFRRKGIGGAGLVDLMAAAGLTAGGFYRHFVSKDGLVAEAIDAACGGTASALTTSAQIDGTDPDEQLARLLAHYLSPGHRDKIEAGCPLAALGSELARGDGAIRQAASDGFVRLAGIVAESRGGAGSAAARTQAMVDVATMIGALTMSRILTDAGLSAALLEGARADILRG